MRKIILLGTALILAWACNKDDELQKQTASHELPIRKAAVNPNDYEIYEYPSNYEEILQTHLSRIESDQSVGDKEIPEAIWIWESGMNYVYAHPVWGTIWTW